MFSRFEQHILFQEKLVETTDPTTDRHGTTDRRGGLVPKYLEFWKIDTEIDSLNFVTEWQDGPSQTLQRNCVSELSDRAAGQTIAGATGRHRLRNPSLGRISLYVLRDVFDYFCFNYKVSGLMLIRLITWGLKEVTLS